MASSPPEVNGDPTRHAYERRADIVLARESVNQVAGGKAAGVDLRDTRHPVAVFSDVEVERSGRSAVEGTDGLAAYARHFWLGHGFREMGYRGDPAGIAAAGEVRQALAGLEQDEGTPVPEGQAGEVPPGEVFGEREGPRRDISHVPPVLDPASRLGRRSHGARGQRAAPHTGPAPDERAPRQPGEGLRDRGEAGHRIGQRDRHAALPQEDVELVLVLTQLDDARPRKKEPTRNPGSPAGKGANLRVARRDEQVDPLLLDDAGEGPEELGVVEGGHQVVPVSVRFLEDEPIAMTADDGRGASVCPQAPDQIAGRGRPGSGEEQAPLHRRRTLTAIRRLAKARRMIGP